MGEDETAFNGRNAGFTYNIGCCTETSEGFDEEREWVRSFWSALEPLHMGEYVNFSGTRARSTQNIRRASVCALCTEHSAYAVACRAGLVLSVFWATWRERCGVLERLDIDRPELATNVNNRRFVWERLAARVVLHE